MRRCVCCAVARFKSHPNTLTPLWERIRAVAAPFPHMLGSPCWPIPVTRATFPFRSGYIAAVCLKEDDVIVAVVRWRGSGPGGGLGAMGWEVLAG